MKHAILLLMIVLIAASAQAVELSFKDTDTGTTIADKIISIDIDGKESTKQIDSQGKIDIQITEGKTIELTVDNPETQGKDYYGRIIYDGENEILLFPVASLREAPPQHTCPGFGKVSLDCS